MNRALLALAILTLAGCASAGDPPRQIRTTVDNPFLQIVEPVTARVHLMRQALPNFAGVVGNVTIIEQSESLVLVDSGNSRGTGERVVEAIRLISDKPVSAVIITHWHNDHPLGLSAIVEAWPDVQVIATGATAAHFAAGETNVPTQPDSAYVARRTQLLTQDYPALLTGYLEDPEASQAERDGWTRALSALDLRARDEIGTYLVLPNRTFRDTLRLEDAVAPIEISFLGRANTDGDLIVYLPRQRVLVAGDIVVSPIPYMFGVFPEDNIRTLERIRGYDFETLIPGHGEPLRGEAYIDLLIAFIGEVRAQVAPLAQQGLTVEEVAERVNLDTYAQRFAGDDAWLRIWFRDYAATPLIQSAYSEARGALTPPAP